jgi:hypothetical protein
MIPTCVHCGADRPPDKQDSFCVPCANTGHVNRVVESFDDAVRRYQIWTTYYDFHEFTLQQRFSIPMYQRLTTLVFRGL